MNVLCAGWGFQRVTCALPGREYPLQTLTTVDNSWSLMTASIQQSSLEKQVDIRPGITWLSKKAWVLENFIKTHLNVERTADVRLYYIAWKRLSKNYYSKFIYIKALETIKMTMQESLKSLQGTLNDLDNKCINNSSYIFQCYEVLFNKCQHNNFVWKKLDISLHTQ